jgi:hypothetical protein
MELAWMCIVPSFLGWNAIGAPEMGREDWENLTSGLESLIF